MSQGKLFIDGQWIMGSGIQWQKLDPMTQQEIWSGCEASKENVDAACKAARHRFASWARMSFDARIEIIQRFRNALEEKKEHLARVISQETSKPFWEALTEVQAMIGKISISIQAYHQRTGESRVEISDGVTSLRHRPHGVLAVFGPYNFPGHLPNGHIIPALIAGNTIVFKPSEFTPWTAEETIKLWQQAGLPNGVINLVQGGRSTGEALANAEEIDGLLFTGSADTGYYLHQQWAGKPEKILALEMGGNNALIIEDVHHEDAIVNLMIQSSFISAGQRCTCARRLLIKTGKEGDALIQRFIEVTRKLSLGAWNQQPPPFMGGVISLSAAQKILDAQQSLLQLGAISLLKMTQPNANSSLLTPGILDATTIQYLVPDLEYFGPLTCIYRYQNFDDALKLANATRFGLSVGLVSTRRDLFDRLLIEARAGIVNWNKPLTGASSAAPFGGIGASGNHRASALYAADYCAWPMASLESTYISLPENLLPGIVLPPKLEH
ncbi:succinylglutamate-semialdehyde dehydrogenase [Acinetobacter sp. ANC 4558]|uniref:succinylglutamate-semialdehyde dehydrogenase n=1 Tax=Acinetobacter sp. ANC 4558 TaxID=1977876 RepID=UPI000A3376F4|nr:succinylglutamate-semialdehyde dehydrogenase [Acinetobacter sp. ANC 4558]OTG88056.1 succinylglutamate-semialdehyde dehydrogenase [Acinetobacter sp. ANC 4558]